MDFSDLSHIMNAAIGKETYDLVLKNTRYINLFTKEIYNADLCIKNGRIAYVSMPDEICDFEASEYYDAKGKYACPGLIDTHVHIESSMITPANFAKVVVPHGTTVVLADPHEICNVIGLKGLDFFLEASKDIILNVFVAAPSCVPSVAGLETSDSIFTRKEIAEMLQKDRVLSLGEVMDYMGVINQETRMMEILQEARKTGKLIQGHLADISAHELAAYMIAGCESDHEARMSDEAKRSLRSGLTLECRYASNCHNMPVLAKVLKELNYPENATMCTDDREPDDLLNEGHIDFVVKQAIQAGMDAIEAVKLATYNAARFLKLKDRGTLKPGNVADILLLDSLEDFSVNEVFMEGKLVAKEKKMLVDIKVPEHTYVSENTMYMKRTLSEADFLIKASTGKTVHTIVFNPQDPFLTKLGEHYFDSQNGALKIEDDYCTMVVIERHGVNGNIGIVPIKDFGFQYGAVAGTVSHDSHNLFVIGKNAEDMLVAANRLIEAGGGFACVKDKKVTSEVILNICGLLSPKEAGDIAKEIELIKKDMIAMGIKANSPINILTAFSLAVIPEIRLTDCGIVDTIRQVKIPLLVNGESANS